MDTIKHVSKGRLVTIAVVVIGMTAWTNMTPGQEPVGSHSKGDLQHLMRDDNNARKIMLVLKGRHIYAGEHPSTLTIYDSSGEQADLGFLSLSASWTDALIDLSALPQKGDPWSPKLGIQMQGNKPNVFVSIRRRKCSTAFIDRHGVVFPDNAQRVQEGGPFISVTFSSPRNKSIRLEGLKFRIANRSGQLYDTVAGKHEILLLKGIPREPLSVEITEEALGKKFDLTLFPMFRSATPGVVLYDVKTESIGEERQEDPTLRRIESGI